MEKECNRDSLNGLAFPGTSAEELQRLENHPISWKSASVCIIPMTVTYLAAVIYRGTYEMLAASGLYSMVINGNEQQMGILLEELGSSLAPVVISFHLPATRWAVHRFFKRLFYRNRRQDKDNCV